MGLRISASSARYQISQYTSLMDNVIKQAEKNFKDMDFENADRREDMEEIIQKMKKDCEETTEDMESTYFEE